MTHPGGLPAIRTSNFEVRRPTKSHVSEISSERDERFNVMKVSKARNKRCGPASEHTKWIHNVFEYEKCREGRLLKSIFERGLHLWGLVKEVTALHPARHGHPSIMQHGVSSV